MSIFIHGNSKNKKIILFVFLSMMSINKVHCFLTTEIVENALSNINQEYLLLNYSFLPKKINDFNYKAENINVDILLEIGDALLENGKNFFSNSINSTIQLFLKNIKRNF